MHQISCTPCLKANGRNASSTTTGKYAQDACTLLVYGSQRVTAVIVLSGNGLKGEANQLNQRD